jgi:ornithine cyclodeaminase/alanine dehydrogenase-like protein (mu-crystallin family)
VNVDVGDNDELGDAVTVGVSVGVGVSDVAASTTATKWRNANTVKN